MKRNQLLFVLFVLSFQSLAQVPYTFMEENGIVVIEAESSAYDNLWSPHTDIDGYTGDNYLKYQGNTYYNQPGNALLTYQINISKVGRYRFQWHSRITEGNSNTDHNDSWLRFDDADRFYAQDGTSILYPHGSGMTPNPNGSGSDNWFKIYQNVFGDWTWRTFTSDHDPHDIYVEFDHPGIYTLEISGRSFGHAIDRMVLYHDDVNSATALDLDLPESPSNFVTSIHDVSQDDSPFSVQIFPNPAQTHISIQLDDSILPDLETQLYLVDASGQVVRQLKNPLQLKGAPLISIEDLPNGLYHVILQAEDYSFSHPFIKQE